IETDNEHAADKPGLSTLNYEPSTSANWGPWSDSHRRIRVYETRPVAAQMLTHVLGDDAILCDAPLHWAKRCEQDSDALSSFTVDVDVGSGGHIRWCLTSRRGETPDASPADWLSKTERWRSVSSIRFGGSLTISLGIAAGCETLPNPAVPSDNREKR